MFKTFPMLLRLALAALALQFFAMPSHAEGALAVDSHKGGHFGFVANAKNSDQASKRVMQDCGDGCQVVVQFTQGCAAFAMDQGQAPRVYGWGMLKSMSDSQQRAMASCQMRGGQQCKIVASACEKS